MVLSLLFPSNLVCEIVERRVYRFFLLEQEAIIIIYSLNSDQQICERILLPV